MYIYSGFSLAHPKSVLHQSLCLCLCSARARPCVWVRTCQSGPVWRSEDNLEESVGSLFPPCGSRGIKLRPSCLVAGASTCQAGSTAFLFFPPSLIFYCSVKCYPFSDHSTIDYFILLHSFILCVCGCTPQRTRGGQRTTCESQVFPSPRRVLGIKPRSSSLVVSTWWYRPMIAYLDIHNESLGGSQGATYGLCTCPRGSIPYLSNNRSASRQRLTCEAHVCEVLSSLPRTVIKTNFLN